MSRLRLFQAAVRAGPALGRAAGSLGRATGFSRISQAGLRQRGVTSGGSFHRNTYRGFGGRNPFRRYKFGKKGALLLGGGAAAALGVAGATDTSGLTSPVLPTSKKPTSKKRKADKISSSFSHAQAAPFAASSKMYRSRSGRVKKYASKRVTRKSTKKRKRKTVIDGRARFKKTLKPAKRSQKYQKRTYLDNGTVNRDNAIYMGFESFGSKDRLFAAVSEACARAIVVKLGFKPTSIQDKLPETTKACEFFFRGTYRKEGYDYAQNPYPTQSFAFKQTINNVPTVMDYGDLINFIQTEFQAHADQDDTTASLWGLYCHRVRITDHDDRVTHDIENFYDTMLDIKITQTIKLQNISPNDGDDQTVNAIGTNPLRGMIVDFSDWNPRVRDELVGREVSRDTALHFQYSNYDLGMKCIPDDNVGSFNNFAKIREPRTIFSNVKKQTYLRMMPNQVKVERINFTCKHTLKTFIKMYASTRWDHGTFGSHKMFMLQLDMPENKLTNNKLKLEFFRNTTCYSHATIKPQKKPLPRIEQHYYDNFGDD